MPTRRPSAMLVGEPVFIPLSLHGDVNTFKDVLATNNASLLAEALGQCSSATTSYECDCPRPCAVRSGVTECSGRSTTLPKSKGRGRPSLSFVSSRPASLSRSRGRATSSMSSCSRRSSRSFLGSKSSKLLKFSSNASSRTPTSLGRRSMSHTSFSGGSKSSAASDTSDAASLDKWPRFEHFEPSSASSVVEDDDSNSSYVSNADAWSALSSAEASRSVSTADSSGSVSTADTTGSVPHADASGSVPRADTSSSVSPADTARSVSRADSSNSASIADTSGSDSAADTWSALSVAERPSIGTSSSASVAEASSPASVANASISASSASTSKSTPHSDGRLDFFEYLAGVPNVLDHPDVLKPPPALRMSSAPFRTVSVSSEQGELESVATLSTMAPVGDLAACSVPPTQCSKVVMSGWLSKKGPCEGSLWKKRFFVLFENYVLEYYMSDPTLHCDSTPKGRLDLRMISHISRPSQCMRRFKFFLHPKDVSQRVFKLYARDKDTMWEWVNTIYDLVQPKGFHKVI